MANMTYAEKLRDPRWQKKRLEIFSRDNWTCLKCKRNDITLNVHHSKYTGNPWDAPNEDLSTICELCHEKEHNINQPIQNESKEIPAEWFYPVYWRQNAQMMALCDKGKLLSESLKNEKDEDAQMAIMVDFNCVIKEKAALNRILETEFRKQF